MTSDKLREIVEREKSLALGQCNTNIGGSSVLCSACVGTLSYRVAKAVAQEVYNIGGCRVMPRSTMLGVCHDGSPCPCGNCAKIRALLGKDGE